jgi:N-acetylglucosaminyldiphosphoundecaprenol N-acetyl-beta-D-mannosaminyltransferase
MQPNGHPKISILGSRFSQLSRVTVHEALLKAAREGTKGYVCVANVHTTMMGVFSSDYREVTNGAAFVVPDGMPLVWAMRSMGAPDQDRVRGPSLMRDLFDLGRKQAVRHYLYGGSPDVVQALREALLAQYPGALIVGAESPPFRPLDEISAAEWDAIAERINSTGAQMVWVGLGAPKQELWMARQSRSIKGIMLGVGAAFDLIPGRIPEAPAALQALGLEWAYRLAREPGRLWKRYIFNNPAFLVLWAAQWLSYSVKRALGK